MRLLGRQHDAARFRCGDSKPPGMSRPLAGADQNARGKHGAGGKAQIIFLVANHETAPGIESVAFAQLFPESGKGLATAAVGLRCMGAPYGVLKPDSRFQQKLVKACLACPNRFFRKVAAADSRLVGNEKKSASGSGEAGKAFPHSRKEDNACRIGKIVPVFNEGSISVKKDGLRQSYWMLPVGSVVPKSTS